MNPNYLHNLFCNERFKHDCMDCVYLGSNMVAMPGGPGGAFSGVDWYSCKNTLDPSGTSIIGRWSDAPQENWSMDRRTIESYTDDEVKSLTVFFQFAHKLMQIGT